MAATSGVRVSVGARGAANVATGVPVLDHLLGLLAEHGGFDLALEVAPAVAPSEVADVGHALGEGLAGALRVAGARGYGSDTVPADEALAHVALEASGRPLVVSNVDLSDAHVAGLATDVVAGFVRALAEGAGLAVHVRLVEVRGTQHVLESIFKALGVALGRLTRP